MRLWEAATGEPLGKPFHCDVIIFTVVFGQDGRSVYAFDWAAGAWRWEVPWLLERRSPAELMRDAQVMLHRCFTSAGDLAMIPPDEWRGQAAK
ncbi:MAG: hypothetical protein AAB368_02545 [bacterium]